MALFKCTVCPEKDRVIESLQAENEYLRANHEDIASEEFKRLQAEVERLQDRTAELEEEDNKTLEVLTRSRLQVAELRKENDRLTEALKMLCLILINF